MDLMVIQDKVFTIRGYRVMLDFDLAEMYEIETKALKQAVRRNADRFPDDFMFELTRGEYQFLRSQTVTLEAEGITVSIFLSLSQNKASLCFQVY
jgi:hypothetical protein